jgi:UDP-GlcNAc:undecaprenyl-phosphate GlcNAc-1-phosphate transferase
MPIFGLAFLVALGISLVTTALTIVVFRRLGWLDDPRKTKHPKVVHEYPVPRGGGIPIYLSLLVMALLFLPFDKHLVGILAGATVLFVTGILDDRFSLSPYLRLVTGFLAAGLVVAAGIGIPYITNPLGGIIPLNQPQIPLFLFGKVRTIWVLADLFSLFWIVSCMNFVNWSKGLDGQLPGVVAIAALTIAALSFRFSADITQWPIAILALGLAGAFLGFLPFNFFPQKIMAGYGAGTLAGYMLAVLSILSTTKVGTAMIVLGVPLVDAGSVLVRRLAAGRSPVWGDVRHLHHKLLKLGWSKPKIAIFYWTITAVLGFLALQLNSQQKLFTILLLALSLGIFLLWFKLFGSWSRPPGRDNG